MIFYNPSVTAPAVELQLQYDPNTGEGKVMLNETVEVPKDWRIQCTTLEEFTILQHLGYDVHLNEHPSEATLHGVTLDEPVPSITPPSAGV